MKSKFILTAFFCVCGIMPMAAQWQRTPTPNDTLQSVKVLSDGRIALNIYAPQAKKVDIEGDIIPWGKKPDVMKSVSGVWTVTVPPVKAGAYRYHFILKANIRERYYHSKTLKTTRRLHVWTPAGYEKSVEKLPVLYLIHGGGDTDLAWPTVGCAGNILDNLLAENKMQPMIVVMPNGSIATENLMDEVPLFAKDLMNDIIPYIEANYRVLTDKDHRALAGLSMGGMETLEAGLNHYKEFGYLWVLSSGWFETNKKMYAERSTYLKTIAQDFNHTVHALHFTQGGPEDIAYNNCKAMLKLFDAAGINYKYSEAPGGHTWYTWRNDLYNLAQQLFKY